MSLLDARNLTKSYDGATLAVDDVSVRVEAGEVLGLLGPNGAGKTTTMMMLAGLLEPDRGSIVIDGTSLGCGGRTLRRELGVVPQDLAVYPELTATENLAFFGKLYGLSGAKLGERIQAVLALTSLDANGASVVGTFSGGMKRRLNFGVALLHEPKLLILDEPTVGVDPQSRSHLLGQMRELAGRGVGVIYASHYMEEVEAICDRVSVIDHGRVIACDSLSALLQRTSGKVELQVEGWKEELATQLPESAEVQQVGEGETRLVMSASAVRQEVDAPAVLADLLRLLGEHDVRLLTIETRAPNLEGLFFELTGRQLRD